MGQSEFAEQKFQLDQSQSMIEKTMKLISGGLINQHSAA
jgi:hypothetical protein